MKRPLAFTSGFLILYTLVYVHLSSLGRYTPLIYGLRGIKDWA